VASWEAVERAAPEFAQRVQALFDAALHKTIATLRKDGAPRISGIEAKFAEGDLWFGSMWQAQKALDLLRDPRFALHSPTGDVPDPGSWKGDAKISGSAVEITDEAEARRVFGIAWPEMPPGPSHLFRAHIREVVLTGLSDPPDRLVIELWSERGGLKRFERD
jgi:hypothetical protein